MAILWFLTTILLVSGISTATTENCKGNEILCTDERCLDPKDFCVVGFGDLNCTEPCVPKFAVCSDGPWGKCSTHSTSTNCRKIRTKSCYDANGKRRVKKEYRRCEPSECQFQLRSNVKLQVNGSWSEWGQWSTCSETCGEGTHRRLRHCNNPSPSSDGEYCQGMSTETETCEDVKCPLDGQWSAWEEWSNCTEKGKRIRRRKCDQPPPQHGGKTCVGAKIEYSLCSVCSDSLAMKLYPRHKKLRLGKNNTFICSVCTINRPGLLTIHMDTEPLSISNGTTTNYTLLEDACVEQEWMITPNQHHEKLICNVLNEESFVIGTLVNILKKDFRFFQ